LARRTARLRDALMGNRLRLSGAATALLSLMCFGVSTAAADEMAVSVETLTLHTQSAATSAAAKQLVRGQRLTVDFIISSAQGAWCRVREVEPPQATGYVRCDALERPAPVVRSATASRAIAATGSPTASTSSAPVVGSSPPPEMPPGAPPSAPNPEAATALARPALPLAPPISTPHPQEPAATAPSASLRYPDVAPPTVRINAWTLVNSALDPDPLYWSSRLGLTDSQRRRAIELSGKTGWSDCRRQLREVPRGAVWEAERCRTSFAAFWRGFTTLLTGEQLTRFEADERAVQELTGIRIRTLYRTD
jgi:hypothetical protein